MKVSEELSLIKHNYCIGCGVCTTTKASWIQLDKYGKYKIEYDQLNQSSAEDILDICPFSTYADNEDHSAKKLFPANNYKKTDSIGYYLTNYVGYVLDESIRSSSSSGGIITWLLTKLLSNGDITYAVHVGESDKESLLFNYQISKDKESIIAGASSRYYPVEMSSVLNFIKQNDGKYAIVALPCFAKGLRLLQQKDEIFKKRIKYIISPICGHLKTTNYAAFLAWQKGVPPSRLHSINFRKKIPGKLASQYGTKFFTKHNDSIESFSVGNSTFKMGTDWGHGMFKYPACDFCDDVVGELADVSVGDAWLDNYVNDYKGNSIIIVRNENINGLLNSTASKDEINIEEIPLELVEKSQAGGIRNKKDDLKYRLWLKEKENKWHPPKRVSASESAVNSNRKKIIEMRLLISQYSHELFIDAQQRNNIRFFYRKMNPFLNRYYIINYGVFRFLKHKIKKILWKLVY